ncbi:MarR family winged helix-turn-helix transcriptional regulator [Thermopetrobacter sp. TC1]|uniref:MarR family winged helix-turn-helix transcriptional regulator n=1 Tax=Thermopetrobacter sp. TC1 TaxID=1495045 RepID=UPI0012E067C9|nr:MarR family transcriptional regulator [Thermopetrobacter sp. TC1]
MAETSSQAPSARQKADANLPSASVSVASVSNDEDIVRLMELLFFAYRDFVSDPDTILAELGFGRAHHRVLHFVGRHPGLRVSELLDILRITKQSLGRVLRELIERGYVYQREGETDRRQRLLYLTDRGRALHARLAAPQIARIRSAMDQAAQDICKEETEAEGRATAPHADSGKAARAFARILLSIVDDKDRAKVQKWIETGRWDTPGANAIDASADRHGGDRPHSRR